MSADAPEPGDERALVAACLRREPAAWRALVERYSDRLSVKVAHVYLQKLGRPPPTETVQEAVQEAFVRLVEHDARALRGFQWRSSLASYLAAVAAVTALGKIRKDLGGQKRLAAFRAESGAPEEGGAPPLELLAEAENEERLRELLSGLSPQERTAIRMRFWEGAPFAAIGKALGTTPDYARVLMERGIEKLRKRWTSA